MGVPLSQSRRELLGSKFPEDPYEHPYKPRHERSFRCALRTILSLSALLLVALYLSPSLSDIVFGTVAMRLRYLAEIAGLLVGAGGVVSIVPTTFPTSGNVMWYTAPGATWLEDYLPVGNGYLAAMLPGNTNQENTQLNIESLWSGGPFQDPTYNGSNKPWDQRTALAQDMQQIRQTIFTDGTIGDVEVLAADIGAYGSYAGAGFLLSSINVTGDVTGYTRWLDMDSALARTQWTQDNSTFLRTTFCSHPSQACVEHINTTSATLPPLEYAFDITQEAGLPTPNITCFDNSTLQIRGLVADPGMTYEILARVQTASISGSGGEVSCSTIDGVGGATNATLSVTNATESWITWVGGTDFDQTAGDAAHSFSFKGSDPHSALVSTLTIALSTGSSNSSNATYPSPVFAAQLSEHVEDYAAIATVVSVDLGQVPDLTTPTDELYASYETDGTDPHQAYVEWLLFNFGRYLLIGSARGALPANLQGKWANGITNAWSADYHANINTQMNYWMAEQLGLNVTQSLWDYMEQNWAPRGSETAKILYNISEGWTTHNEMNIFGHTGMKLSGNSAQWADYPESSVWMMIHVWDHFDYTGDTAWWKAQGYPLLKGVTQFQLQKLIQDEHFNDGRLVTAPCNSPEQTPITLGCSHQQQLIWQLLNAAEKGYQAAGDTDATFLSDVQSKRAQMDMGIHIGWWGQLQEWKIDMDSPTDTHRHLSHLVGLYPGYAVASFNATAQSPIYTNSTLQHYTPIDVFNAAEISLIHRGNGTGPDADSGWEKVWRAAAWAQLANATEFYHELSYAVERSYGPNLLSEYGPGSGIFQIDANLGYPAAVINALVQAPDTPAYSDTLTITLLPALPDNWAKGSVTGFRIRGGMTLDMKWSDGEPTEVTISTTEQPLGARPVQVKFNGAVKATFSTGTVSTQSISF
ncbi:uncharacterized protein STEHIDRAFT_123509 [Stereum hirsutum FP-91666 SS1]|uniref:uncharacterized protein n=1 Tax=Stereum hirsutum (strain FP-91666) TaxID=721885 RepID=UPI000444A683|nr:uncharacterized protein STEHIDRAFT_123509 [Stereum hirsutum FP-91666 SS1]EIM83954.1 hypothetical protein STEHIDRAFT_123509 [Stereum hirsutum FP-91666 SS1]